MRGFYESQGLFNGMKEGDLHVFWKDSDGQKIRHEAYLCGFLGSTSFRLREWCWGGLAAALFWRLSLRKEDHQRIVFTE